MERYLAELVGTFLLAVTALAAVVSGAMLAPAAVAAGYAALVLATAPVSGGHLNPAVSLAAVVRGRLPATDLGPYVAAQLLGALLAFLVVLGIYGAEIDAQRTLDFDGEVVAVFLAEAVFTFALAFGYPGALRTGAARTAVPAAIAGLVVLAGAVAVGGVSGGAFNPALTFALTVAGTLSWAWIWLPLLAQAVGALAAALVLAAMPATR